MMKRMDQLKFMVDLDWKIRFAKHFDDVFSDPSFLIIFNQFLATETGKKWLESEHGKKFIEWQES